jgi:pimeloyl-ACP methyl ester carboxylesterase
VSISPLEWTIRPDIEAWADVAVVSRGLSLADELDRLDWESCVVVGDEWGGLTAIELAESAPDQVRGFAFGHACLYEPGARHKDVEPEIWAAYKSFALLDYRAFARALTQVTGGSYGDEIVEQLIEDVPQDQLTRYFAEFEDKLDNGAGVEQRLRSLNVPMLFARHAECLMWTKQGFDSAIATFPDAVAVAVEQKPSVSAEFERALREFCESLNE